MQFILFLIIMGDYILAKYYHRRSTFAVKAISFVALIAFTAESPNGVVACCSLVAWIVVRITKTFVEIYTKEKAIILEYVSFM